ncbi:MAG: sodium/solute symporter, partial [Planctomycetes bacterium]|nr:sodium/solute symporter [Planctomycetota bacterium]
MRLLAAILMAVSSAAPAAAPPAIDAEPFRKALEDHVETKLRGELVEKSVERARRGRKLAERGIARHLLEDLCAQHDKAAGWAKLRQEATQGGSGRYPLLEQLPTKGIPPERESELRQQLLDDGVGPALATQVIEAGNAVRRLGELWQQVEAAIAALAATQSGPSPVRLDEVQELLRPPAPLEVKVRRFKELEPKGERATARALVAVGRGERLAEGEWGVEFELKKGAWTVTRISFPAPSFGAANYAMVGLYLAGMLVVGWWASRRISGTRGFFIGDGKLNHIVVGISIMTTYLSSFTMMGLSASAFSNKDWTWAIQLPFLVLTAFVITRFVLPRYREAGVISVYQYLEQRIHVSARLLASLSFIIFSVARMGLVLYLPALAFSIVTGADLLATIVVMGAVVTAYTAIGGIEAVVWTDVAQAFFIVVGAVLSVVFILGDTGLAEFGRVTAAFHKFRLAEPDFPSASLTQAVALWLVLETIFQTVRIYGTQQDMTQRYMTTASTRKANASVWIAILLYIPLGFGFYFIGSALFAYYTTVPDATVPALVANGRADAIYPYFVASRLPAGVAGIVIAAIFAAAMSSIDALMNSSSTVCIEDFYRRFSRVEREDSHYLSVAKGLTWAWGLLATLMAISFMEITRAQDL